MSSPSKNASMRTHFRSKHRGLEYPHNYNPYTSLSCPRPPSQSTMPGSSEFRCEYCQRGFSLQESLRTHIMAVHQARRFTCTHCGGTFSQSGSLKIHIRSQHEKVKETCEVCQTQYSSRAGLR